MQQLKALFPNAPLAKHEALHVFITRPGPFNHPSSRALIFPGLGRVNEGMIAKEFFLAYFEGHGISPAVSRLVLLAQMYLWTHVGAASPDEEGCGGECQQPSLA